MFYPEDFKAKVKIVCPDKERVHQLLEDGDAHLGAHLSHAYKTSFSFKEILDANSIEELKNKANSMKEIYELFLEWQKLYDNQNQR